MLGEPAFLDLEEAARVAGHSRWLESRLFEIVGAWVAAEPDPEVKLALATQSLHHGDHARGWRARQPRVAHLDAGSLTVPAGPGVEAVVEELAAIDGSQQTVDRLVALAGVVLPALVAAYRVRLARAHPLADGPTTRWLSVVASEEQEAREECRRLLEARLGEADAAEAAERRRARLEGCLQADAGGLVGLAMVGKT